MASRGGLKLRDYWYAVAFVVAVVVLGVSLANTALEIERGRDRVFKIIVLPVQAIGSFWVLDGCWKRTSWAKQREESAHDRVE